LPVGAGSEGRVSSWSGGRGGAREGKEERGGRTVAGELVDVGGLGCHVERLVGWRVRSMASRGGREGVEVGREMRRRR